MTTVTVGHYYSKRLTKLDSELSRLDVCDRFLIKFSKITDVLQLQRSYSFLSPLNEFRILDHFIQSNVSQSTHVQ